MRCFTLIETIIVLVVLGVLLTISIPAFLVHIQRAKASEAVATLELIRQAEREYFSKHNTYLNVASPNLKNDPHDTSPGLNIDVGITQYFSNAAYSVDVPGSSSHFTTPPATPVDFVIKATGSASVQCSGGSTDCAVKQTHIANYQLEMDNTGRVFVCYRNCGTADQWKSW